MTAPPERRLEGRVVVVTGAARTGGIGRATALRLAGEGASVACIDLCRPPSHAPDHGVGSDAELGDLVTTIRDGGGRALALVADITSREEMSAAAARTRDELGPVWACCALAGGVGFGNGLAPVLRIGDDEFNWVLGVNLTGTWITLQEFVPQMISAGNGGRVVTVGSAAGVRGARNFGAYAAAKAGVVALTRSLAIEVGRHGITANVVVPGMIETQASQPVRDRLHEQGHLDDLIDAIPLGRFGAADEVAAAIAHLCSDDAAYVTGDIVNLTGGQVMS